MLSVSVIWCNIEALKKNHASKWSMKCLKKVKIFEWPVLPYSFSPIDCSVMKTVRKTQNLISISNHKYLDNQTGDWFVKFMRFLTGLKVYNYHCRHELNPGFAHFDLVIIFRIWLILFYLYCLRFFCDRCWWRGLGDSATEQAEPFPPLLGQQTRIILQQQ